MIVCIFTGATVVPTSHSEVDSPAVRAIREMGIQEDIIQRALVIFHNRPNTGKQNEMSSVVFYTPVKILYTYIDVVSSGKM